MSNEVVLIGVLAFIQGLFVLYVETRLKKSIEHKFDVKLKEMEQAFSREMADRERKDKFRLAALDERLRVHQKAFGLARDLLKHIHSKDDDRFKVMNDCESFWNGSSLYLTKKAREAFWKAMQDFGEYRFLQMQQSLDKTERAQGALLNAFDRIVVLPSIIAGEVDLEAMGSEAQPLFGEAVQPIAQPRGGTSPIQKSIAKAGKRHRGKTDG